MSGHLSSGPLMRRPGDHDSWNPAVLQAHLGAWPLPQRVRVRKLKLGVQAEVWLVERGKERWVAKFAYQHQHDFEAGLRAAEIVQRAGVRSGQPLRTRRGALTVMVEGPPGHHHPLAVLEFVHGSPVGSVEAGRMPETAGAVLGRVHSALMEKGSGLVTPHDLVNDLAISAENGDVGQHEWVRASIRHAIAEVRRFEASLLVTCGVIYGDGPELLVDAMTGSVGLIDWGGVAFGPLLYDVGMWTSQLSGRARERFVDAYRSHAHLRATELYGIDLYHRLRLTDLARYFAWRTVHKSSLLLPDGRTNEEHLAGVRERLLASY